VTTHQVTVLEDVRGVQAIHLHNLTASNPAEDFDTTSEKGVLEGGVDDNSVVAKRRTSDSEAGIVSPTLVNLNGGLSTGR
jgi:hypothetical protein